jgi:hypothetical protein
MGLSRKTRGYAFFGLEYDHDDIPNAIVLPSARGEKIVKWVKSYKPITYIREADKKLVRRERIGVVCPIGFRLRKDEIKAAMKRNKTENWQDGKFFVIRDHKGAQFEHPDTVAMKKEALQKEMHDVKRKLDAAKAEQSKTAKPSALAGDSDPAGLGREVSTVLDSGVTVTDKRNRIKNVE